MAKHDKVVQELINKSIVVALEDFITSKFPNAKPIVGFAYCPELIEINFDTELPVLDEAKKRQLLIDISNTVELDDAVSVSIIDLGIKPKESWAGVYRSKRRRPRLVKEIDLSCKNKLSNLPLIIK